MKKKLFLIMLMLSLVISSLASCMLMPELDEGDDDGKGGDGVSDTVINVEGGPNYGDINITATANQNLLAASKAMLSAVSIQCRFEVKKYNFYGSYVGTEMTGSAGSGVIYKLDKEKGNAYIITNYHVVYHAQSVTQNKISDDINLFLYGMEYATNDGGNYAIPATYVGGSMEYDIAVLKVEASTVLMSSNARSADVADSDGVSVLDTAIAIGNPDNGGLSATVGHINVDSEEIDVAFETESSTKAVRLRVMRTDAAVNSGNSGGGLFNDKGELIGIVNAKTADSEIENVGYAIPSNVAKAIADNAIHYSDGAIYRGLLGITVGVSEYSTKYDTETGKLHRVEKVVVSEIADTSAVKDILKVGDVINSITVDGVKHEVTRIHHVVDSMLYAREGSSVTINVTRGTVSSDKSIVVTSDMISKY